MSGDAQIADTVGMEKARGFRLDDETMRFEDRVGVPCLCGRHRLGYAVIVRDVTELDVVVEPWERGTLLKLVFDGKTYASYIQECYPAPSPPLEFDPEAEYDSWDEDWGDGE